MSGVGLAEHGSQWEALAMEAEQWALYLESRGEYGGAHRSKAATYRRVVESFKLEASTGVPHCVCCLKPTGKPTGMVGAR